VADGEDAPVGMQELSASAQDVLDLPATVPVATAKFVLTVQSAIVIQASLAFLGLSNPATISWGGIIHRGVGYGLIFVSGAWQWWLVPPVVAISLLICGLAMIGWAIEAE